MLSYKHVVLCVPTIFWRIGMTTFFVILAAVVVFAGYMYIFVMARRDRWKVAQKISPAVGEVWTIQNPATEERPKTAVQAAVGTVKEAITLPKLPSVRMAMIGGAVLFKNGRPYTGMIVGSNRHGTRLRIACRINGTPSKVSRRARRVRMLCSSSSCRMR
jgi:hypothetical protein